MGGLSFLSLTLILMLTGADALPFASSSLATTYKCTFSISSNVKVWVGLSVSSSMYPELDMILGK